MTDVIKLDGSPGGGKSYTLEQRLRDAKDDGLGLTDFWWLNFTTSGRKDVEPVLEDLWPDPGPDIDASDRAKTVHGLALSLAIRDGLIDPEEVGNAVIQQGSYGEDDVNPFADFCERHAVPYNPDADNARKLLAGHGNKPETGNKLFAINDYLRQKKLGVERWRDAPVDIRTPGTAVKRLLKAWDRYKREHEPRLYEHGDYVNEVIEHGLTPDVDLLLIDEFQDLAPLEYKLYKQWRDSGQIERIYISGDPNQSIYSFRGGTPLYFEETDVDGTKTLKQSYRCPSNIANVGYEILSCHPETDPRGFDGKNDGGTVRRSVIDDATALRDVVVSDATEYGTDPSVLLLTRTNYQLRRISKALRDLGVPFKTLGSQSGVWGTDLERAYAFLRSLGTVETFPKPVVDDVLKRLPDGKDRLDTLTATKSEYRGSGVEDALDDFETVLDVVDRLDFGDRVTDWKRSVLRNALDAPNDITPGAVKVGTIHTSKGLEAPSVYLFVNSSKRTERQYRRNDDYAAEEHRIYYVGATRASDKLTLVDGYFEGPVAPPIQRLTATGVVA